MIDTSKAVRPCVEELASWINYVSTPRNFKPLWLWKDVRQYFKDTFTQNGITFTNNNDGTFTAEGTATANLSTLLTSTPIPYTPKEYTYKTTYSSSQNITNLTIGKLMLFYAPLIYENTIGTPNLQVHTNMTCSVGGQQSTTTLVTFVCFFSATDGVIIGNYMGRINGNHSADEIEVSNCGIDFRLYVPKGAYINSRFTLVAFDCLQIANTDNVAECEEIIASFGRDIKYINAIDAATKANQVILENALWKAFDGDFESEYAQPIKPGSSSGYTYYTVNNNS